jgi:L-alanine-DL-glutamate epimerase-like enolase superfamily enzyme
MGTIVSIEAWVRAMPYHNEAADRPGQTVEIVGVSVIDEAGGRGMGFTYSLCGGQRAIRAVIEDVLTPVVIGRSVSERVTIWDELAWAARRLGTGVVRLGLSALDIALWDLAAREQHVPLHELLGKRREQVVMFSSGRYSTALATDRIVANALEEIASGMRAIKLRIGGRAPDADLKRVEAVREAVDDDVVLMVDAAELLTLDEALWLAPRLEELGVRRFEEPLPTEEIDDYRRLRESSALDVALGEHLFTRAEFLRALEAGAADVLNPDVAIVGGVTEFMRICELAEAYGCGIAPHLVTDLHLALAPAIPALVDVEAFPFTDKLWSEPPPRWTGQINASDRHGHGLELLEEPVNPHPRGDTLWRAS